MIASGWYCTVLVPDVYYLDYSVLTSVNLHCNIGVKTGGSMDKRFSNFCYRFSSGLAGLVLMIFAFFLVRDHGSFVFVDLFALVVFCIGADCFHRAVTW